MDGLFSAGAVAVFLMAAGYDLAERRIPNGLVLALAALGLARLAWGLVGAAPVTPGADLAAAAAIFASGAVLFHLSLMGGGDVKLLAAGALWLGAASLAPFIVVTALAGGALAFVYMGLALALRLPRRDRPALPYGVAIAAGGILTTAAIL